MHAYCYASGLVEFGDSVPRGALPIARGPARRLRNFIEPLARHGYDAEKNKNGRLTKIRGTDTLLVPGVPEAPDQSAALAALERWLDWIKAKAPNGIKVS